MKALQLLAHGTPGRWAVQDIAQPLPAPDEVSIRVRACGLNHLDLWLEEGGLPIKISLPRIPGSEVSGEIVELGSETKEWKRGDRVAVQSNLFCGKCEFCLRGEESLCLHGALLGVDRDGGLAENVVAPVRSLVGLPEEVDFATAAGLALAGSTAVHMLTDRVKLQPGQWVLVIGGASGVGSAAIQIAKLLGGHVISTGSTPAKRELAMRLGADFACDTSSADWAAEVRRFTGKRGVDVVVEHVGGTVLEQTFQCLARGGTVVTCGATAGREVRLQLWPFFVKQFQLVGSYGRTRANLEQTLKWAAAGKLRPIIDRTIGLPAVVSALADLRDRRVLGKIIVQPEANR